MTMMKALLLCLVLDAASANTYRMTSGSSITLMCPAGEDNGEGNGEPLDASWKMKIDNQVQELDQRVDDLEMQDDEIGTAFNPGASCENIKERSQNSLSGLYYIQDTEDNAFITYCDMDTDDGGWTLVASVHENNMAGKCTVGDRWSSEQGSSASHPHGDGFWENRATHGAASSATSDDYKNSGYFTMQAKDIMIWHVPNDTPLREYKARAIFKYRTNNGFLSTTGGNLQQLYSEYYQIRDKEYVHTTDNGPAYPIIWDKGSDNELMDLIGEYAKLEVDPGYVQFRVLNHERHAFALCPGIRMKSGKANSEHYCVGSTSNMGSGDALLYCGDYGAKDWPYDNNWVSDDQIIKSTILIFYR